MAASIPFAAVPTTDPADNEPITTRQPRKVTFPQRIELLIDAATAGLGPILIFLAFLLLSLTIFCYFSVFIPFHYRRSEGEEGGERSNNAGFIANMVWSCYLVWGIVANYYYAVTMPPGSVLDGIASENVCRQSSAGIGRTVIQAMQPLLTPLALLFCHRRTPRFKTYSWRWRVRTRKTGSVASQK